VSYDVDDVDIVLNGRLLAETALERDYFMTGTYTRVGVQDKANAFACLAREALSFGIVDSILEKRPKSEGEV
jgi:hypothetical protein